MNLEDYKPDNFHPDKFHALKCLWLHDRKYEIFSHLFSQVEPGNPESFLKISPVINTTEQLQRETGLSLEDIAHYSTIGGYIREYIDLTEMTPEQVDEHIEAYEQDPPELDPEDLVQVDELWNFIGERLEEKHKQNQIFEEIINDNFNDQEKWSDG